MNSCQIKISKYVWSVHFTLTFPIRILIHVDSQINYWFLILTMFPLFSFSFIFVHTHLWIVCDGNSNNNNPIQQQQQRFDTMEEMQQHRTKHLTENKFKCEICGKEFPSHSSMWKHTKAHTGDRKDARDSTPMTCDLLIVCSLFRCRSICMPDLQ